MVKTRLTEGEINKQGKELRIYILQRLARVYKLVSKLFIFKVGFVDLKFSHMTSEVTIL